MALNLKFTSPPNKENEEEMRDYLNRFVAYVKAYFDSNKGNGNGGIEIQFNITKHEDFVDAVKNPDKYPELLVRVSGYTAYFKDLNPYMQKEIIDRTEYQLLSGKSIPYDPFPLIIKKS